MCVVILSVSVCVNVYLSVWALLFSYLSSSIYYFYSDQITPSFIPVVFHLWNVKITLKRIISSTIFYQLFYFVWRYDRKYSALVIKIGEVFIKFRSLSWTNQMFTWKKTKTNQQTTCFFVPKVYKYNNITTVKNKQ